MENSVFFSLFFSKVFEAFDSYPRYLAAEQQLRLFKSVTDMNISEGQIHQSALPHDMYMNYNTIC